MQIQNSCDSSKIELKSAINSMNADSISRTYIRFKQHIADQKVIWQEIRPEQKDQGLYAAIGACLMMYESNISVYYEDIIRFYTGTLPRTITERSIEIRGKVQMTIVREELVYQYLAQKQNAFQKAFQL
jgi:hypothetical protein